MSKVRLFLDHPLAEGQDVPLEAEQAHYLFGVMRLGPGSRLLVFNGREGEWEAEVAEAGKRGGRLTALAQTRPQEMPPDLWLLFAPIKKARTDFIVEKAAEMGARRILPVHTEFTNSERVKADRLRAHAVEAAEQCGGVFVPEVGELTRLGNLLSTWDAGRSLWFCDETLAGGVAPPPERAEGPGAVLIGPEGGFSEAERAGLRALPFARPIRLGPRILRADTAWARRRSALIRSAFVNSVCTGRMRRHPISAAFSTMKSVRAFLIGAKRSHRSGGSACARVCASGLSRPPRLPASATSASHSPSRPLKTRSRAPGPRRITPNR